MRILRALTTLGVVAGLAASVPAGANAATSLACTASPGPTIAFTQTSTGPGLIARYYHRCNTAAFGEHASMVGTVQIVDAKSGGGLPPKRYVIAGGPLRSAAGTVTQRSALVPGHSYYALEELRIGGSFSYGSVPGCSRVSSVQVRCLWRSPTLRWWRI